MNQLMVIAWCILPNEMREQASHGRPITRPSCLLSPDPDLRGTRHDRFGAGSVLLISYLELCIAEQHAYSAAAITCGGSSALLSLSELVLLNCDVI